LSRPLRAWLLGAVGAAVLLAPAGAAGQAPPNDNRGAAEPLGGANVAILRDNIDATTEPGELRECVDPQFPPVSPFDSTIWFSYDPPAAGTAVFSATGGADINGDLVDTVTWVYGANGAPQACDDGSEGPGGFFNSQVGVFYPALNPAPHLVQVGGFDDGVIFEQGIINFSVNFSPATRVAANLKYRYQRFKNYLRLTKASVSAETGSTIEIDCKGSCGFKGEKEFARSPVNLKKLLPRRLNFGTTIDIFVTEPNRFGYYARLKIKPKPKKTARCLAAGVLEAERNDISACPG